jgi:hypothetical protein
MNAVAPAESAVEVLRAISRAGFEYAATKVLCEAPGWRLLDDEPDCGYVKYEMVPTADWNERRQLSVQIAESGRHPQAFVPVCYIEEYEETRQPFDDAFRSRCEQFVSLLGVASHSGEYKHSYVPNWSFAFAGWSLWDATLILVQNCLDPLSGLDVTLWVLPAGSPIAAPVRFE